MVRTHAKGSKACDREVEVLYDDPPEPPSATAIATTPGRGASNVFSAACSPLRPPSAVGEALIPCTEFR